MPIFITNITQIQCKRKTFEKYQNRDTLAIIKTFANSRYILYFSNGYFLRLKNLRYIYE